MNKVFFAFGKAVESKETTEIKRYVGIAPVQIVAINPTKKELETIYNTTIEKEPEYLGSMERDGKNVPHIRIDFIVKTNPEKSNGIEMTTKMSFFVRKAFMTNRDNTKVKVIDKYGRTAWVTQDEFKNKLVPQYANGPARIDNAYRALYMGEEELLNFVNPPVILRIGASHVSISLSSLSTSNCKRSILALILSLLVRNTLVVLLILLIAAYSFLVNSFITKYC